MSDFKLIKCQHRGCDRDNTNASIFTVGKGHYCGPHFTGDRAKTVAKKEKAK